MNRCDRPSLDGLEIAQRPVLRQGSALVTGSSLARRMQEQVWVLAH